MAPSSSASRTRSEISLELEQVGGAPEVERERALGERAELALEGADVGVVDVPVGHVGHLVADRLVRSWSATSATARTSGPRAANSVTISSSPTAWPSATPASTSPTALPRAGRGDHRRTAPRPGPLPSAPSGPAPSRSGGRHLSARAPGMVASQAFGVGGVEHREAHRLGQPAVGIEGELGVEGQPGGQREPGRFGGVPQHAEGRPGPLGVDVVGGDRRDAAPVVDPGGDAAGPGRRRGWAAPADGSPAGGPAGPRRWSTGTRRSGTAGRGAWTCPAWAGSSGRSPPARGRGGRWLAAIASSASRRSARDSPMPTSRPVVKGIRAAPGGLQGGQPPGRGLVGRRAVGGQIGVERLDHHPLAGRDRRSRARSSASRAPALAWGSRPVSSSTARQAATR